MSEQEERQEMAGDLDIYMELLQTLAKDNPEILQALNIDTEDDLEFEDQLAGLNINSGGVAQMDRKINGLMTILDNLENKVDDVLIKTEKYNKKYEKKSEDSEKDQPEEAKKKHKKNKKKAKKVDELVNKTEIDNFVGETNKNETNTVEEV